VFLDLCPVGRKDVALHALEILCVTPYLPSPPGFGGQRRLHGLFTGLARSHRMSVVSLVNASENHERSVAATREYCREVVTVGNPAFALPLRAKRTLQLRSLLSPRSFEWLTHVLPELQAQVRRMLSERRYDVVLFEFTHLAPHRRGLPDGPLYLLDEHNVEYEILRRTALSETGALRKLYNGVNWRKLRAEEHAAWRSFDGVSVTSTHDRDLVLRDLPRTRVAVVPNAVDLEFFAPRPDVEPVPGTLLFFGAINYFPNADGLQHFLTSIFPHLPQARLSVVGHTPESLFALSSERIAMKGFVDDVREEIAKAAVVIAPLRVGGGTRLKILEAMAMGKPIVSTPEGAEGLEVVDGRDVLLAREPREFARKVAQVLAEPGLARTLGANARKLAEDRYGWPASVARLEQFIGGLRSA
jgi:glycosyltransferase involved in cell wall biosynthesis